MPTPVHQDTQREAEAPTPFEPAQREAEAPTPFEPAQREAEAPTPFEPAAKMPKRRMLIVVNPYATTVSDRLRHLILHALEARYEVDAVDTEARGHATELCREAAHEGYDVVVAFGGDGTVNEAANGLIGSETPLSCLPGGSTNVFARMLGIPGDPIDATEHLLSMTDDWRPRKVDVGVVNGRCFAFSSGLGLDASVVERVDSNPRLKARFGPYFFTWAAINTFVRRYLLHPPRMVAHVDGERLEGVTAIVQNSSPFTYFLSRPIEIAQEATLDSGTLSACVLHRARPIDMPFIAWRAFAKRAQLARHRHITPFAGLGELSIESADGKSLPLQVDGDYLGEVVRADYSVCPRALNVVS